MRRPMRSAAVLAAPLVLACASCAPNEVITRVPPETITDLERGFNDTDARETYRAMVTDALYRSWLDRWYGQYQRAPVIVVGPIRNDTQEYIDTRSFTTEWERELLNSDRVTFVAMQDQRDAIRQERQQGQEWNTPETRKAMRAELGADLILLGRIGDSVERAADNRTAVSAYKINLELINLESNQKVWIGSHEIKKIARLQ